MRRSWQVSSVRAQPRFIVAADRQQSAVRVRAPRAPPRLTWLRAGVLLQDGEERDDYRLIKSVRELDFEFFTVRFMEEAEVQYAERPLVA